MSLVFEQHGQHMVSLAGTDAVLEAVQQEQFEDNFDHASA